MSRPGDEEVGKIGKGATIFYICALLATLVFALASVVVVAAVVTHFIVKYW